MLCYFSLSSNFFVLSEEQLTQPLTENGCVNVVLFNDAFPIYCFYRAVYSTQTLRSSDRFSSVAYHQPLHTVTKLNALISTFLTYILVVFLENILSPDLVC